MIAAESKIIEALPEVRIKMGKTQIDFYNKYLFATLWPPIRRIKGRTGVYLGLTFGLSDTGRSIPALWKRWSLIQTAGHTMLSSHVRRK